MIKFSKDKVKLLHQLISEETGGTMGVRDEGLLESALEGAFATFDGKDLYPSKEEKLTFLEVNGIRLEATNEEVAETGLAVATGTMGYQELLNWVIDHRA